MKAVRLAFLACALFCGSLSSFGQSSRDAITAGRSGPPADASPRVVGWHGDTAPSAIASTPSTAAAPISGSIVTFGSTGPQQIFASKSAVFLGVGSASAPCQTFAFLPDGTYIFQVTDPSGTTLLSTDPASERTVTVKNGVIASYNGTTHVVGSKTACGSLTVGLAPFRDVGTRRAQYVVWLTPSANFEGNPSTIETVCGPGCFHGFRPESSRAFAFRVEDKPNCEPTFCASGIKFSDTNGNGSKDAGEPGLPGVEIRAVNESGVVLSTLTGADGAFQICGLVAGDFYKILETVPFGYNQTGPRDASVARHVFARGFAYVIESCDSDLTGLDFANQLIPNAIGGVKYEDLNANGRRDPGEPGLSGVTIRLTPASGGASQTATTDANGNFLFTNVPPGSYVLTETVPSGFTQTEPASAAGSIAVTLAAGGSSINNVFGNFRGVLTGAISGVKFLDVNGNGVRDPGEAGVAGVGIILSSCPSPCVAPPIATTKTGADGTFSFTQVPFGTYFVSEAVPSGFRQTTPAQAEIIATLDLSHQSVSGLIFGNQAVGGSISGTKFNDVNGNRLRDAGEPGISGVTIRLQSPSGTITTTTTDASGNFSFSGLNAGTYVVSEVVPPGFVQTAPAAPGTISVTVASGQSVTGLLIGNQAAAAGTGSISGTKILDINGNGVLDGIDRPFQGIVFVLTDANGVQRTSTSDANGVFTFTSLPAGTYTLTEQIPPGFAQTFPGTPDLPKGYTITLTPGQTATGFLFLNKC